jgi:hypothetical protein
MEEKNIMSRLMISNMQMIVVTSDFSTPAGDFTELHQLRVSTKQGRRCLAMFHDLKVVTNEK